MSKNARTLSDSKSLNEGMSPVVYQTITAVSLVTERYWSVVSFDGPRIHTLDNLAKNTSGHFAHLGKRQKSYDVRKNVSVAKVNTV